MKILITGGAGFIGSALIRYLIKNTDVSIINVDKLTYAGHLRTLEEVSSSPRYHFEQCDICSANEIQNIFMNHQPDAIMHLAAETHVDRSINSPNEFIQTNVCGTFNLLQQALAYWQSLAETRRLLFRFHHISTDEVFGDLQNSSNFFTENTAYAPSSPYSASKASADHLVRAWHKTYGLPILITNCSNNYGPFQNSEKLIPFMILNALTEKPLTIYGDGKQVRDWLYVDDHVRALYCVLTKGRVGETYNIGADTQKENIEVVDLICDLLEQMYPQKSIQKIPYKDLIKHIEDRKGHDTRYAIDASKIKNELGWSPVENFESGMQKTIQWYINNQAWMI